ncbi:MAG: sigma-70 family RNA polymerase sigma factor [Flavobacteriales bacterium]|nr:sigma-70 family RNA polymerase sigma factor [Flavobacteriales bacterium]MCB9448791.1 sigma-70 family RNA polymerase sigma factor [Flavobacteriales bacterium]
MQRNVQSDQELIKRYIGGDSTGIEILFKRHKGKIYTYILMLVKNDELAQDILQDTFVKIIVTLDKGNYNEEGKFMPWVLRIAHNLVIDHFRRNNRMPTVPNRIQSSEDDGVDIFDFISNDELHIEDQLVKTQIRNDLRRLIRELPDEQREVLMMRHYADMSFKEIAAITNVSINTALGRMRYALINLRKLMEKQHVNLYTA